MTTSTTTAGPRSAAPAVAVDDVSLDRHSLSACQEIHFAWRWFQRSRKLDDSVIEQACTAMDTTAEGVSIGKKILASKHDTVKTCNQSRTAIKKFINLNTVPRVAIEWQTRSLAGNKTGARLVRNADVAGFDRALRRYQDNLTDAVQALTAAMPAIKEMERDRLLRLYRDEDYPEDIGSLISFSWNYQAIQVDSRLSLVAREIYEEQIARQREEFNQTMAGVAQSYSQQLIQGMQQLGRQLGCRKRINPPAGHRLHHLAEAEVLTELRKAEEAGIPEGQVRLEVRYKGLDNRHYTIWLENMTEEDFEALNPYNTTERRRLYESTLIQLQEQIDSFQRLGELCGPYQGNLQESMNQAVAVLRGLDIGLLRNSDQVQQRVENVVAETIVNLQQQTEEIRTARRRLSPELVFGDY